MSSSTSTVQISRGTVEQYPLGLALGIAESKPRLSWRFSGTTPNWTQKSYDIRVTRSTANTDPEEFHVDSSSNVLIPWPSKPLAARESAKVEIRSNGTDGSSTDWSSVNLERGLEEGGHEWKLISGEPPSHGEDKSQRPFRLRKSFHVDSTTKGRLYITAQGVYEVYLNGRKVSPDLLAPGWTDYRYHLNLQTYDVSSYLVQGENVISAWIGDGWFCGRLGFHGGKRSIYGDRMGLMAHLEVEGKRVLSTDESWEWSYGSIVSSELYDGEEYDSSLEEPDWQTTSYKSTESWKKVEVLPLPKGKIVISQAPPVKEITTLPAKEIITTPTGKIIVDFGQNFAGVVRFKSNPPSSTGKIVLRSSRTWRIRSEAITRL
jgi:alpha-L-rhamnosidase